MLLFALAFLFCSWRIAVADYLAYDDSSETARKNLERAVLLIPFNADYLLRKAFIDRDNPRASEATVEQELQKVLELNPGSAGALLNLGLLELRKGNTDKAERYLLQAEDLDHTFKPVWTLANFYFQTNQFGKMWPLIHRCLSIASPDLPSLSRYSADPIFELCWRAGASPRQVLGLTPKTPTLLLAYFFNALSRKDWDAAMLVFPSVLPVSDPSDVIQSNAMSAFCWGLLEAHRIADSVVVWNMLVEKKMVKSTILNPDAGRSLADAELHYAPSPTAFGWVLKPDPHFSIIHSEGAIDIVLDGRESENLQLMSKNLPVLGGRTYALGWKTTLAEKFDTNLPDIRIILEAPSSAGNLEVHCPERSTSQLCRFTVPEHTSLVRLMIIYRRSLGVVRLKGTVRVSGFHLDLID